MVCCFVGASSIASALASCFLHCCLASLCLVYSLVTGLAGPGKRGRFEGEGLFESQIPQRWLPGALMEVQLPHRHSPVLHRPAFTPSSTPGITAEEGSGTGGASARRIRAAAAAAIAFLLLAAEAAVLRCPELVLETPALPPPPPGLRTDEEEWLSLSSSLSSSRMLLRSLLPPAGEDDEDEPAGPSRSVAAVEEEGVPLIWMPTASLLMGVGAKAALAVIAAGEPSAGLPVCSPGVARRVERANAGTGCLRVALGRDKLPPRQHEVRPSTSKSFSFRQQ